MANVASVSSIVRQPGSEMVDVSYNQLVPRHIQGSLDDPAIRQLLMLATENSTSAGVRDDSVGLLAAECRAGHSCQGAGIRDALMVALRYDRNAGVREKALEGLEPYVAEDMRVRNAVLEALLNDSDPRIRTESINILEAGGGRHQRAPGALLGFHFGRQSPDPECFPAGPEPGSGDSITVSSPSRNCAAASKSAEQEERSNRWRRRDEPLIEAVSQFQSCSNACSCRDSCRRTGACAPRSPRAGKRSWPDGGEFQPAAARQFAGLSGR